MYKILIVGLLGTCFAWFFTSENRFLNYIEKDVSKQLSKVVTEEDKNQFDYSVAGRDVILHVHNIDNRRDLELIREKFSAVPGVNKILMIGADETNSSVAPAIAAMSRSKNKTLFAELEFSENQLTIIGNAAAPESTAELLEELTQIQGIEVNNFLDYHNEISPRQWLTFLYIYTEMLPTMESGRFLITDKVISYSSEDEKGADRIAQTISTSDIGLPIRIGSNLSYSNDSQSWRGSLGIDDCNRELNTLLTKNAISFKHESDELSSTSLDILESLELIGRQCGNNTLVVEGHTDSLGAKEFNRQLSQRRANVVKSQLILKGFNGDMIDAIGAGEENPIDTNDTRPGRANNRRIEVRFVPFAQG